MACALGIEPREPGARWPLTLRQRLTILAFVPAFALLQALHWIGFTIDEVLFRGYRGVEVRAPVFVVGPPRTGTTFLHRVLARDERFTTFRAWECLLAPSVTERKLVGLLVRADAVIGRPGARLLGALERRVFGTLAGVHDVALDEPEEDYLALLPVLGAFILVVPFPFADWLWRWAALDRDAAEGERAALMGFYTACLKKHLYAHGPGKTLLSKNASFAGMAGALREAFPDARILFTTRDPLHALPSQLSSIRPGVEAFGYGKAARRRLTERIVETTAFYYANVERQLATTPEALALRVPMEDLAGGLEPLVETAYARFGLEPSPAFRSCLAHEARAASAYRSSHRYRLDELGLDAAALEARFGCTRASHGGSSPC